MNEKENEGSIFLQVFYQWKKWKWSQGQGGQRTDCMHCHIWESVGCGGKQTTELNQGLVKADIFDVYLNLYCEDTSYKFVAVIQGKTGEENVWSNRDNTEERFTAESWTTEVADTVVSKKVR